MKQKIKIFVLLLIIALAVYLIFVSIRQNLPVSITNRIYPPKSYGKIVSLAPSTTEILFALGLGNKVIGVSEFCNYPDEAKNKPRLGGLLNPNYEAIVAAKPDLVIVFEEMLIPENKFAVLNIKTLAVRHNTIRDILDSILSIGLICGKPEHAESLISELEYKMHAIQNQYSNKTPPKVLIAVGHNISRNPDKPPENIYIAGNDGFYSAMIILAGGQNAYTGTIPFPTISCEAMISMNPEIIIDIVSVEQNQIDPQVIKEQWKHFSQVDAVKNDRIYVFGENYMAIPGPRFILALEKIALAINHEIRHGEDERKSN
jgi:iron complex transport system substrate-binding protein